MVLDRYDEGPAIDYLLKEVSFSTCDNKFFGELEKEMLIPNNVNIHGRIKRATSIRDYKVRLGFPEEALVGFIKQPLSSTVEGKKRVLTYGLQDLINYDEYWWLPTGDETVFSVGLNLLPPFPDLHTVGLGIACRPDVAVGLETDVTSTVQIEAKEDVDNLFLKLSAARGLPGVSVGITGYSDGPISEPQQSVFSPRTEFPFPRLSLRKGQTLEYEVKTKITANPSNMTFLRCEQDLLQARLLTLTHSLPNGPPCGVEVLDNQGQQIPVHRTVRSNIYQATAQIMYSPFSSLYSSRREAVVKALAA